MSESTSPDTNESITTSEANTSDCKGWLKLYLRAVGGISLLAFAAAVMPESWMVTIAGWLGRDSFPEDELTFYLARNLSVIYGFIGVGILVIAADVDRYRDLIGLMAIGTMCFGICQIVVNLLAGMPPWWAVGEGVSTIFGGALMYWLHKRSIYDRSV